MNLCLFFTHNHSFEARKLILCMKVYFYTGKQIDYAVLVDRNPNSLEATIAKNGS